MSDQPSRRCLIIHPGAELYGSDRVMRETAVALVESGWRTITMLPQEGALADDLRANAVTVVTQRQFVLRKSLIRPERFALLPFMALAALWRAVLFIRRSRPDLIYVSTVTLPLWPIAAWLTGARCVIHVHEAEAAARPLVKRILYGPARLCRSIVVNSEFTRSVIAQVYPKLAARSDLIYNGVAGPPRFRPPRASLDERPRVVYVGRISHRKGPDLVVEAAAILRDRGEDIDLQLVGDVFEGYEWFEQDLQAQVERLSLHDRVHRTGFVVDVWGSLADADIMVVPSRLDEPFGNTAVEGALAGRPLVVSYTSGLREATTGLRAAHLIAPDDARAIADAISTICADWMRQRELATEDAPVFADRFAPARYRREILAAMANQLR